MERKHLQAAKRDAYKDLEPDAANNTATHALLKKVLAELSENDRIILEMRHFDGLGNQECANLLKIEPKAASIRYIRALQRLRLKLTEYTEFRP